MILCMIASGVNLLRVVRHKRTLIYNVLSAILRLEAKFLIQPHVTVVQPQIVNNNQIYPYFKVYL